MKPNLLLLLAFPTIMAGGCAGPNYDGPDYRSPDWRWQPSSHGPVRNYHGPEYYGSPENLPPALWDSVLNGVETNTPVSSIGICVAGRRGT